MTSATSSIEGLLKLTKIGLFLLVEAPIRPRWAYYRARAYLFHYILNRAHTKRVGEYRARMRDLHDAVAYVTGVSDDEVRKVDDSELIRSIVVQGVWVVSLGSFRAEGGPEAHGPIEICYGSSAELLRIINLVCRLVRPEYVLETGVAKGFTTASALEALERNQHGHLYSVELPSLYIGYAQQVGEQVPRGLRHRWTLEFGPSALVMPKIMQRTGRMDVFVHDSAANYDNQMTEYRLALAHMPAGGVLISDMLNSDAFIETAEKTNCRWAVIEQSKPHPIGLLSKLS